MATKEEKIAKYEDELDKVDEALTHLYEGGQSVTVGDVTYTDINYSALQARKRELERKLSRLEGDRPATVPTDLSGMFH